jgi:hypothetical protein
MKKKKLGKGLEAFFFFFFVVVGIKPRALCILGKHLTTELHPQAYKQF